MCVCVCLGAEKGEGLLYETSPKKTSLYGRLVRRSKKKKLLNMYIIAPRRQTRVMFVLQLAIVQLWRLFVCASRHGVADCVDGWWWWW